MDLQTLITYVRRVTDDPKRLLKIIISPCARGLITSSWKEPSSYRFLNALINIPPNKYKRYTQEIRQDAKFFSCLHKKHGEVRNSPLPQPQGWTQLIYVVIRHLKPRVIVETGVLDGISSSFILNALYKNRLGKLISVDLPARKVIPGSTDLMPFPTLPASTNPGWLIPDYLKSRWSLRIIQEGHELKHIIAKLAKIDIFLHDSLHTKEHIAWEIKTVWPHLKKGGLLLVDDIFCNDAFKEFCVFEKKDYLFKYGLGAIKK